MAEIIVMPKLGFNMSEGRLVSWYKKEGEPVRKGENLFAVETDKTSMDIEATGDGFVKRLLIEEGDVIPVTLPIAVIGGETENVSEAVNEALRLLGNGKNAAGASPRSETGASPCLAAGAGQSSAENCKTAPTVDGKRLKITPRARRKAEELGISPDSLTVEGTGYDGGICEKDVLAFAAARSREAGTAATPVAGNMMRSEGIGSADVTGTGANGKIMKQDVLNAMAARNAAAAEENAAEALKLSADGKEILKETPYAGVRKIIGERLAQSKFTAPHLYFTQKVDLLKLLELRREVNAVQAQKTSVTDFIAKAVVNALIKYPEMNSSLLNDTIVTYKTVNLGIAVAAPGGLIVPVVRNAESRTVTQIAEVSSGLFAKARAGKLTPDEYSGGTFTISNLGMFGIENFTAIINPPEMGILAVSSTKDEAVVVVNDKGEKEIAIRPMMNIQLTTDHRVIDGLLAAQFVTEIKNQLEQPISLMV